LAERIITSLSPAHHRKKKNSAQISPYTKLTQTTAPILGGQKPKGKEEFNLEARERETSNTISLKKKGRQPWKQGSTSESHVAGGAITIASLPRHDSIS